MTAPELDRRQVGQQLGHLEYVIDQETLAAYHAMVGSAGRYANLLTDDCRALLRRHGGCRSLTTVWQRFRFMRPPTLGRRIQVAGWLRGAGERRGLAWRRVSAFAVDEIGAEIMRSEAIIMAGGHDPAAYPTDDADATIPPVTVKASGGLAEALPGDCRTLGSLEIPEPPVLAVCPDAVGRIQPEPSIRVCGSTPILVGWLEGLLGRDFGDDFRWGGSLAVAHHGPVEPGDVLTGDSVVVGRDVDVAGVVTWRIVISVRNHVNRRAATAQASVVKPSPRLL